MNAEELVALVRRRIESRYKRILFVHKELERLNALAKLEPLAKQELSAKPTEPVHSAGQAAAGEGSPPEKTANTEKSKPKPGALPGRSFEDFVFSRINFSVYKKIDTEEFNLLFCGGLDDYDETFYQKAFSLSRKEIQKLINESYVRAGPFYLCKKSSPLLLSIMRTLHTSLDFASLIGSNEITDADQIKAIAEILDGLVIRHDDGMETKLFMPKAEEKNPGIQGEPVLCGTFHPLGKACTITLIGG